MLHPEILQFLIVILAFFARKGYYELFRYGISNVQVLNYGELLIMIPAVSLMTWVFGELIEINQFGVKSPSLWLLQTLQIWLWISLWVPGLIILWGWLRQWRLPSGLIGIGRGFLTFGVPIGLISWLWLGRL